MVINLWAEWCGECHAEFPYVVEFAKRYEGRVQVLGVDSQDYAPNLALGYAKLEGATYPMVVDFEGKILAPYLPISLFINARGEIAYRQVGPFDSEKQIEQLVAQYLGV